MPLNLQKFTSLPDTATVRIVPIEGGLTDIQAVPLIAVLDELMSEWKTTGVITEGFASTLRDNYFVMAAWQSRAADLSGCTKDSLTHALLNFEQVFGKKLLNAPRLAVETAEGLRLMSNAEFRALRREDKVGDQTRVYDLLVTTLGDVRAGKFETTVGQSWYAKLN